MIDLLDLAVLQRLTENKKIIVFGVGCVAAEYGAILSVVGLVPSYYLDDLQMTPDKRIQSRQIISIEKAAEIKEEAYILLTELHGQNKQAKYLSDKGFCYIEHFNFISGAHFQTSLSKESALDATVGYSSKADNVCGCRFLGENLKTDYKIAVNGASLVDETCFDWKLWPQLLYERMIEKEKQVSFMLCASYGHNTSQCLLRLLRDILPLKPNMVIDYLSLENDFYYGDTIKTPFIVGYQKRLLSLLKNRADDRFEAKKAVKINIGNEGNRRTAEVILDNIHMSKLLCGLYGIRYICVLPPSITTMRVGARQDEEIRWAFARHVRTIQKIYEEIEEKMPVAVKECIVDARSWVDGYEGLFYDQFHMKEEGNSIIADKMMKVLGI